MDKMFSPRTPYSKTPLSSTRVQRTGSQNRRTGLILTPTSKRSLTPTLLSSRNQSNRQYQASVIDETAQHAIIAYGAPLPVLVTEAITLADRIADISVRLEESGWASLVCGRRLFIWKYKQEAGERYMVAHCCELTLPPSDLAHKADLVHVFLSNDSQMPSALAVSPEGIVRYWPNIVHEGSSVEATADLQGQECYSLTDIIPLGFILATTTSTLVLITPTATGNQHNVICHTLKTPQGVLAGIGRKVSSFIFGAMPPQASEAKQLNKVLTAEGTTGNERILYMLSSCIFQKWILSVDEPYRLLYEQDMDRLLKEHFFKMGIWPTTDATQLLHMRTWSLDMQLTENGVIILAAAMHPDYHQKVFYAFAVLNTSQDVPALNFSSFLLLKHMERYQNEHEEKLLSFQFIFPGVENYMAYIYSAEKVFCTSVANQNSENDLIDVSSCGNILGAGVYESLPLFFTQCHGLLALQMNQAFSESSFHMTPPQRESLIKGSMEDDSGDSLVSKLRLAMCCHCNNDIEKCQEIITEAFPSTVRADSELDATVISLSSQIIDDYPVSDPRWCESVPTGDSVSSSLIILHQLEDKLTAHDYLLNFLKAYGLFERLSTVKTPDSTVSTKLLLCEHAEKLTAAKVIRRFVVDHTEILDTVIQRTLSTRKVQLKGLLTFQDMYFREVSAIGTLFKSLIEWEEEKLAEDDAEKVINIVTTVNNMFIGVLNAVLQYRQSKGSSYGLPQQDTKIQYLPWTSGEGPYGLRTLLLQQHALNIQYTLKATVDVHHQGIIFQQIVDITDFILDGYASQMESVKNTIQYESLGTKFSKERNRLIIPLLEVGQYDRAASLAEKYEDFDILVQICEDTNNREKLQRYTLQFRDQGFSHYMFKWYIDKGMRGKLLVQPVGQQEELSQFLKGHKDLSWLHHVGNHEYNQAQTTLKELALKETSYLSKKKTLLSLSKLATLASEDLRADTKKEMICDLNLEQDLIMHQENLPDTVVEAFGLDRDAMRVFSPEELIEMYICDENSSANAFDFKIALELLNFLKKLPGDSEYESLRCHIWCRAILRDNWDDFDTNNPLDAIKDTVFFQIIELAFDQGVDLHDFVVPVDDLLQSPELNGESSLADSPNFVYLLRAGYEHIFKLIE